jgi:hypothetical protein
MKQDHSGEAILGLIGLDLVAGEVLAITRLNLTVYTMLIYKYVNKGKTISSRNKTK